MNDNIILPTPEKNSETNALTKVDIDRIIEMAWEDRTTFEAIEAQFALKEKEVITLMRQQLKRSSFNMWRKRTNGRSTKHGAKRGGDVLRFKCSRQKTISQNKISKR
ncbi:MAG: TIGR03643 family protein [Ginsengibacter sp.]